MQLKVNAKERLGIPIESRKPPGLQQRRHYDSMPM
jgi:hypothetical protein